MLAGDDVIKGKSGWINCEWDKVEWRVKLMIWI